MSPKNIKNIKNMSPEEVEAFIRLLRGEDEDVDARPPLTAGRCPECGEGLISAGGCRVCPACGWEACGW